MAGQAEGFVASPPQRAPSLRPELKTRSRHRHAPPSAPLRPAAHPYEQSLRFETPHASETLRASLRTRNSVRSPWPSERSTSRLRIAATTISAVQRQVYEQATPARA
jgi:hypothetical protein